MTDRPESTDADVDVPEPGWHEVNRRTGNPPVIVPTPGAPDLLADLEQSIKDATGRTDTATEPLFEGQAIPNDIGGLYIVVPPEAMSMRFGVWSLVDVYPAGVRPAAPTVTLKAADVAVAVETAIVPGATWSIPPGGFQGLADALNRLLAGQGGEG